MKTILIFSLLLIGIHTNLTKAQVDKLQNYFDGNKINIIGQYFTIGKAKLSKNISDIKAKNPKSFNKSLYEKFVKYFNDETAFMYPKKVKEMLSESEVKDYYKNILKLMESLRKKQQGNEDTMIQGFCQNYYDKLQLELYGLDIDRVTTTTTKNKLSPTKADKSAIENIKKVDSGIDVKQKIESHKRNHVQKKQVKHVVVIHQHTSRCCAEKYNQLLKYFANK